MKRASHRNHGRGDAENGPDDPDCGCRVTSDQGACARAGCGFCLAAGDIAKAKPVARKVQKQRT